jgi:hypothetical protein
MPEKGEKTGRVPEGPPAVFELLSPTPQRKSARRHEKSRPHAVFSSHFRHFGTVLYEQMVVLPSPKVGQVYVNPCLRAGPVKDPAALMPPAITTGALGRRLRSPAPEGTTIHRDMPCVRNGPERDKDQAAKDHPSAYLTRDDARALVVHDDIDPIVPHYQRTRLEAALKAPGVPASFRAAPGDGQKVGRSWFSRGSADGIIPR